MAKHTKIEALHALLAQERRRMVAIAAETGALPPAGLLAHLADLDGATLAVEAVLEEGHILKASVAASQAVN